jgi:hypothetical protein
LCFSHALKSAAAYRGVGFSIIQYKSRLFGMGTLSDMLPSGDQLRTKQVSKLIII